MKRTVRISSYCRFITIAVTFLLCIGLKETWGNPHKFNLLLALTIALIAAGLFYSPVYIKADSHSFTVRRLLRKKVFPYADIESVEVYYPRRSGIRLCASGGFMGYWGYFHDSMAGAYFGYYGDHDYCFLVRMKNGRRYVFGCDGADKMAEYISERIRGKD